MNNLKERLADMSALSQSRTPADALKCIMKLEAENKRLKSLVADVIYSTGDDPEIMAASRAEWAARALATEAKLANRVELETVKILVTSAYKEGWSDGSEGIALNEAWEKSLSRTALAELTGGKDE